MSRRRQGTVALAALAAAAVGLLAAELAGGARGHGALASADPCTAEVTFPGDGVDATIQRVVLSGLNGAACELGATREELVLSFVPAVATREIRWDRGTIERALRSGLERAVADAEARGNLPSLAAFALRELVARAPLDWLLDRAGALSDLLG